MISMESIWCKNLVSVFLDCRFFCWGLCYWRVFCLLFWVRAGFVSCCGLSGLFGRCSFSVVVCVCCFTLVWGVLDLVLYGVCSRVWSFSFFMGVWWLVWLFYFGVIGGFTCCDLCFGVD